jgi:hypothetical protein
MRDVHIESQCVAQQGLWLQHKRKLMLDSELRRIHVRRYVLYTLLLEHLPIATLIPRFFQHTYSCLPCLLIRRVGSTKSLRIREKKAMTTATL